MAIETQNNNEASELNGQEVQRLVLQNMEPRSTGMPLFPNATPLHLIENVPITLHARLGKVNVTVGELFSFKQGSTLKLDKLAEEPTDLILDGKVVARGILVAVDDYYGIQITDIPQNN